MGEKKIRFCDMCNKDLEGVIYYKVMINKVNGDKTGKLLDGEYCEDCFMNALELILKKDTSDMQLNQETNEIIDDDELIEEGE